MIDDFNLLLPALVRLSFVKKYFKISLKSEQYRLSLKSTFLPKIHSKNSCSSGRLLLTNNKTKFQLFITKFFLKIPSFNHKHLVENSNFLSQHLPENPAFNDIILV